MNVHDGSAGGEETGAGHTENITFPSKRGAVLALAVWTPLLTAVVFLAIEGKWPGILILLFPIAFVSWIWLRTEYTLTPTKLRIVCGPFSEEISLSSLRSVNRSRTLLSSPALSLDRMRIDYGRHGENIVISPSRPSEFLNALRKRCPSIAFDDHLAHVAQSGREA